MVRKKNDYKGRGGVNKLKKVLTSFMNGPFEDGGLGWQINPQRAKIDFPLQNSSRIEEMVCTSTSLNRLVVGSV